MWLWSIARILWGVAMLLIYVLNIELFQPNLSFLLLFLLFVICEIAPILAMLDHSYVAIISFERKMTDSRHIQENLLSSQSQDPLLEKSSHILFGSSSSSDVSHNSR